MFIAESLGVHKRRRPPPCNKEISCNECGVRLVANGWTQKYCRHCSEKRDLQRKRLWARTHPPSWEQLSKKCAMLAKSSELSREAGIAANVGQAWDHTWIERPLLPVVDIRFSIPFSYAASKNHIFTTYRHGHVHLRQETKLMRQAIARQAQIALMGRKLAHNKLWIDLLVQKPNHRGDAVNVVDMICNAITDATGIDDRWFCIRRLDWQVVKKDPLLLIGLSQETREDAQVCACCGMIKPLTAFTKRTGARLGICRICRECRHEGARLARERWRERAITTRAAMCAPQDAISQKGIQHDHS